MKKAKNKPLPQASKISDFFSKVPTNGSLKNVASDSKRRLSDGPPSPEKSILNSLTNLPPKCTERVSPDCKRIKQDEDHLSSENGAPGSSFRVETPTKGIRPSSSMRTPTPVKGSVSGKSRTPQSGRKGTPKKLFEKSPRRVEEFNVRLLEAFVQVSPSLSNKTIRVKSSPNKGSVQSPGLPQTSSHRGSPAQKRNETTPVKTPKSPNVSPSKSPKFRTKLSFLESVDTLKKETMDEEDACGPKSEFEDFLQDEFDTLLSFEDGFSTLDLSEPQHCTIVEVSRSDERLVLKLENCKDGSKGTCNVEEFWASNACFKTGSTVSVTAERINDKWTVNNTKGWLVYEPHFLIPCTSVVGSLFCKRKSVLQDRFRGFEGSNRIMLIGTLTHTLLQRALSEKMKTAREIQDCLRSILASKETIKRLFESGLSLGDVESELRTFVPKLISFIAEYVTGESQPESANWQGRISDITDIEENLWSPDLGLKGKIDVTIATNFSVMPLELKTGRATVSLEHRGQIVMYIMMMNKFGYPVSSGLLLYLREGVLKEIKATPQERRDVMILRNELAYYLARNSVESGCDVRRAPELPEPLNNSRICPKCPYNVICTSYLKYENHDLTKNKSIQDVQSKATGHLTQAHLDYFLLWNNLLTMEEEGNSKTSKSIRHIYTVPPTKREASGKCIINVKVAHVRSDQNGLYEHTFEKDDSTGNLTTCEIFSNNYVIVSTNSRPAVAAGFVREVSTSQISILLDRNLNSKYQGQVFHLDTYDTSTTYTFNMTSLALLLENTPRASELRSIIIDRNPPTFKPKLPAVIAKKGAAILKRLNVVQQKAVLKALCANDFLLIEGMPGTGKSATIVALIQLLVALDKSVLVTSHTHSAIDNICIRLQKRDVDFLRLGSESKMDPCLKANSETTLLEKCTTPEEMQEVYSRYKVIVVTCLGSGHPLLSRRKVDFCIVDESTQVLQPSVIRPLHAAKTFVLIGDPNQLAPVVRSRGASEAGMSQSLFERLQNPDATIALNLNYRMNQTITELANVLTYGGQLKTGSDDVANRTMKITDAEAIKRQYKGHQWLLKAMDSSLEAAVQVIDTGPVWQHPQDVKWHLKNIKTGENYDSQSCINVHEVAVVVTLVRALLRGGVAGDDIGVIATYRAQVAQISQFLDEYNVDVSTVDQFQGRDKNIIVYSCTKSVDPAKRSTDTIKYELLEDKRRLTVAITRAKRKLLIVGDVTTLERFSTFSVILPSLKNNIIAFDSSWTLVNEL